MKPLPRREDGRVQSWGVELLNQRGPTQYEAPFWSVTITSDGVRIFDRRYQDVDQIAFIPMHQVKLVTERIGPR